MRKILIPIVLTAGMVLGSCGDVERPTCASGEDCGNLEVCERNYCRVCEVLCVTSADCTAPKACSDYGNGCKTCK